MFQKQIDLIKIYYERWCISLIWKNIVKIYDDLNNKLFVFLFLNVKYLVGGEICVIDIKQYERKQNSIYKYWYLVERISNDI